MPTEAEKIIICSEKAAATSVAVAAATHSIRDDQKHRLITILEKFVRDAEAAVR